MRAKRAKICHFYTEIVKFGLILTHLKIFGGGKLGGQENILGGQIVFKVFNFFFMQVTIILEFPASYCYLARGNAQVYLLYFLIIIHVIWNSMP